MDKGIVYDSIPKTPEFSIALKPADKSVQSANSFDDFVKWRR